MHSLSEITHRQFKAGIMTCVIHDRYGLLEDLPFLPMTRFDPDLSCCIETDGSVNGFLLVHKITRGPFRVELFFAEQPDANMNLSKRQLIPKNSLKGKIARKYRQAFGNKTVWKVTQGKRANHSKNKLRLQDHLKEEYELLSSRREEEMQQYVNYINEDDAAILADIYNTPEEKEALREWAMEETGDNILLNDENMELNQAKVISNVRELVSDNVEERRKAYSRILTAVDSIDIDQFAYSTDRDFASNYAKKYELLCKGSAAEAFLNKFREEGGGTIHGVCLADLEGKRKRPQAL